MGGKRNEEWKTRQKIIGANKLVWSTVKKVSCKNKKNVKKRQIKKIKQLKSSQVSLNENFLIGLTMHGH